MAVFLSSILTLLTLASSQSEGDHPRLVAVEPKLDVPEVWSIRGSTPREAVLELTFAVKQQNIKTLHDKLMQVSDPQSPKYGAHLSNEDVHRLTAPKKEHVDAVIRFLNMHGITGKAATPNSDQITAVVPVDLAEKILSTRYVRLAHKEHVDAMVDRSVDGYSLPEEVAAAVDFVSPVNHIPSISTPIPDGMLSKSSPAEGSSDSLNTPKSLRKLYNVDAVGSASANKQAVTAFLRQFYSESALKEFWSKYCSGIQCGKGLPKLVGDATTGQPGTESMLDIEYITGVGGNIETEFWGYAGNSPDNPQNEPFMKWLQQVSSTNDKDVPKLFSTSYGEGESTWSPSAAARLNVEFMKAGARGITLLYASGDSGASCKGGKFTPNMPASSPYVTAVGGTEPSSGFPEPGSESAIGLSSGGFSNYFATPDWQKESVQDYLKQPSIPDASKGYNVSGRGFPDIAAQATNFCVTPFGCGVAGTSCASPTAAGVFGLLNDLRLQDGKSTLGFLNPLLYQNAAAFNDITTGSSQGCSFFGKGWPATKGWDAVTGLGTPDYDKLAKIVVSLPGPAPVWERNGETDIVV